MRDSSIRIVTAGGPSVGFVYTAEQWSGIRRSLAVIGVDADAFGYKYQNDFLPLRDRIEGLANIFLASFGYPRQTSHQQANEWRTMLDKEVGPLLRRFKAMRQEFEDFCILPSIPTDKIIEMLEALTVVAQNQLQALEREPKASSRNASKPERVMLFKELVSLWQELAGSHRTQRQQLAEFIFVCAQPVIPTMSSHQINHFLDATNRKTSS